MPSVDELLNAAEVTEATLTETNDKIEIDADTRTMIIPDTERIFGVMSDEKGERKYFRCKRFVGNGIDLSKLSLRIVFQNASGLDTGRDKYIVTDLATDGEDYVTFSWELSRKVTAYKGIISFVVCAIKTNSDGTITNEWNTTLANGIVLEGLEANGTQEQEQVARDYYNQLEAELLKVANEQKTELEKKAQEVIKTIPNDYTQMQKDVDSLKEDLVNFGYGYTPFKTIMPYNSLMGFTEDDIIPNSYISEYSGDLKPYDGWFASKWIPYTQGEIVRLYETYDYQKATPMPDVYYAFYDADYKFISGGFTSANNLDIVSNDEKARRLRISHANVKTQLLLVAGEYNCYQSERASRYIKDWKSPNIDFVLPPRIYHFNEYINIYYDNLFIGSEKPANSCIGFSDYAGSFQKNSLIIRPNDNHSYNVDMMCSFDGIDNVWYKKQLNTITHALIVKYVNTGYAGKTINVMFLGDSITANGTYPNLVKEYFAKDSSLTVNLIGTLQDGNAEGRGGWGADTYTTLENYNGYNNAFWFNGKFDFSSYMATNFPNTGVDLVFINLGINDMLRSDNTEPVIENYNKIIDSIKTYNPNVKIAVGLPILPADFEYADSIVNGLRQFEKRKRLELIKALIAEYGYDVYYAPFYMAVDCKTDFPTERKVIDGFTEKDVCTDITHPNHTGYAKIASVCQPIIRQVASTIN